MIWINAKEAQPPTYLSTLAFGVIEGEKNPDTHEAFWNGEAWKSVRSENDSYKPIGNVTLWANMPRPDDRKS